MAIPDYSAIATLFEGDAPAGVDLRADRELVGVYHDIRDARSAARSEDRSLENPVVIDNDGKAGAGLVHQPSARWKDVHDLAYDALTTRTKDIELLAWLAESAIRIHGIEALDEVLQATADLIGAHFDALHSGDDETVADRVAPLAGLNGGHDSDGTLIRPLRLNSLSPANIYGRLSLWDYDKAKKTGSAAALAEFQQEFSNLPAGQFLARTDAVKRCLANVDRMDADLTVACGADGPSFGRIRDVLDDIIRAYADLAVHVHLPAEAVAGPQTPEAAAGAQSVSPAAAVPGQIADREQAFRLLLEVAAFFKRTEPHSTIPMALETLVRRGRMDFVTLLAELLPDENQRREMMTRAGIKYDAS